MARSIINEGVVDTDQPLSQINVTSLVDVMFCLLIMFMIATPLMTPEGKEVQLPPGRGEPIDEQQFLYGVISVDANGNVFLGTLPLASEATKLQSELAANTKLKEDGMVFIQGDENASFDRIVDVLVALKKAEITRVGFITDPNIRRIEKER